MIKTALITNIPSPYRQGLFEELHRQKELDFTVYYCARIESDRNWDIAFGDYRYHVLKGLTLGKSFHINPAIISPILGRKYDAVILGGYYYPTLHFAALVSLIKGIPLILWNESNLVDCRNRGQKTVLNHVKGKLMNFLVSRCGAFLVPGTASREYLTYYGAPENKIFIAPTTCDVEFFRKASRAAKNNKDSIKTRLGIKEKHLLIFAGRLVESKGVDLLLEAFLKLRETSRDTGLIILGSGPLENRYREFCKVHKLDSVYFTGFKQLEELPVYYGISDILVFPSRGDPWALVVNEAMACGLPVITTYNVGAAYDLVKPGINGALVDSGSSEQLFSSIKAMLKSPDALISMGKASATIISGWTHKEATRGIVIAVKSAVKR